MLVSRMEKHSHVLLVNLTEDNIRILKIQAKTTHRYIVVIVENLLTFKTERDETNSSTVVG